MIAKSSLGPVLVVGGGPAGATAARALARAGVPVRILDRAAFPRNKPCGGGISTRVLARFPHLEPELSRIATHAVSRLHLEGPDRDATLIESERPAALMIRRVEFDALLVSLAQAAGAELVAGADVVQADQSGDRVAVTTRDGRRFEAPIVIAADGVHSVVARRLGLNPGWPASAVALDMMEETPRSELRESDPSALWVAYGYEPDADAADCEDVGGCELESAGSRFNPQSLRDSQALGNSHSFRSPESCRNSHPFGDPESLGSPQSFGSRQSFRSPQSAIRNRRASAGYAYIFPKRDHVNVGVGYVLSHYRAHVDASPYELQRGLIGRLRKRGIIAGDSVRANFTPFIIPVGGPLRRPGRGRVLLAGDAGGFVNGFTAEGIYYAMVSGDLAARAVVETAANPASLADAYCRACSYEIGAELRDSVAIQRFLFSDRRRIAQVIAGAPREAALTRLILDFACGGRPYRDLRRQILARSPRLAWRLIWDAVGQILTKNSIVQQRPAF